jgi:putative transposase
MSNTKILESTSKVLEEIRKSKEHINAKTRRYSDQEISTILQACHGRTHTEVSKLCGIKPSTISKWQRRHKEPTAVKTEEPHYNGYHKHWQRVLELWRSKPGLGPAQLSNQLRRENIKISVSTVRNILEENGYTPPRAVIKSERVLRYEAARPRELVHMDFKHFYIHKQKTFLLLLQDDYSRFLCGYKLTDSENMDSVIEVFEDCISKYGKMLMLMTDAGSAFYSWNGMTRFQKLISEEYGIDHIKAGSPRSNGKVESVNKQIEKELLNVKEFSSLDDANHGIAEWIEFYNFERTHMGLPKGEVPADRFLYGWNKKTETLKEPKNPVWEEVLKVAINKMK